jgi:hypothetical protein
MVVLAHHDFHFHEELDAVVQREPANSVDPEPVGLFAAIGIKKGQPFASAGDFGDPGGHPRASGFVRSPVRSSRSQSPALPRARRFKRSTWTSRP